MLTGWLFKIEKFPLFTKWGMYAHYNHDDKAHYIEFYKKDNDGLRKINFVDKYSFLNNGKWLDLINYPSIKEHSQYRELFFNYNKNAKELVIYNKVFIFKSKSIYINKKLIIKPIKYNL